MRILNLFLTLAVLIALYGSAAPGAQAQDDVPVAAGSSGSPVVVELFSSQACVFCPAADRLFGELLKTTNVIGLACHVDYFDVKQGSLARHFCSDRQSDYMTKLRAGPNYTPQIVIDGHTDVVGYKQEKLVKAINEAAADRVAAIDVQPGAAKGTYTVSLPALPAAGNYMVWLAVYDKPHSITIGEGSNRGTEMTYYNIVSSLRALDPWDGTAQNRTVTVALSEANAGFAVLAQDTATGRIVAAGRFEAQ